MSNKSCTASIIGPDSWIDTDYDITTDDCGFFTGAHETDNNCHAFSTNIAANTFSHRIHVEICLMRQKMMN